jgi:short-subunit dehydrogenase
LQEDVSVDNVIRVNALQVVYLMKIFEEKMLARDARSAIIVTSSIASKGPAPCS